MEPRPVTDSPRTADVAAPPVTGAMAARPAAAPWPRASWRQRAVQGLLALAAWTLVAVAGGLDPAAVGLGTHEQLGMKPCAFHQLTGRPCPGCGLTTAFANMGHGRVVEALIAQPFGAALFVLVLVMAVGLTAMAVAGWSCLPLLYSSKAPLLVYGMIVLWLAGWGFKAVCMTVVSHP